MARKFVLNKRTVTLVGYYQNISPQLQNITIGGGPYNAGDVLIISGYGSSGYTQGYSFTNADVIDADASVYQCYIWIIKVQSNGEVGLNCVNQYSIQRYHVVKIG